MPDETRLKTKGSRDNRLPVTLLSGFLGAGKTTLLSRLLRESRGRRMAVIVNDVGQLNIDGALIRSGTPVKPEFTGLVDLVELTNGCVCCSIQEELGEAVAKLAKSKAIDHLLIEGTGAAEPLPVVKALNRRDMNGAALMDSIRIHAVVTVVDTSLFDREWEKIRQSDRRRRLLLLGDRRRPVFELILEQIEYADLILLNQRDRVDDQTLARALSFMQELNERAEIKSCSFGEIDPETILASSRFDREQTLNAPRWKQELQRLARVMPDQLAQPRSAVNHGQKYGLTTFAYRARQPFDGRSFSRFIHRDIKGLLRAKGFYWTRERPDEIGQLSVAGDLVRSDFVGKWWIARLDQGVVKQEEVPANILQNWHPRCGDRRQEIVFIGVDMNEADIRAKLDACLDPSGRPR